MPFSYSSQISSIVGFAETLGPAQVLDVGAGMGTYGFLLRNHLENTNLFEIQGDQGWQRPREDWKITIDGIEGFLGYRTPVHDYAYNQLMVGNAMQLLPQIGAHSYDLVIAIDILEHFDREDAFQFIQECQRVSRKALLISTPKEFIHQEIPANPLENHRSHWSAEDLKQLGFSEFIENPLSWIAIHRS